MDTNINMYKQSLSMNKANFKLSQIKFTNIIKKKLKYLNNTFYTYKF